MKPPKFKFSESKSSKSGAPKFDFSNKGKTVELDDPTQLQKMVEGVGGVIKAGYDLTQIPIKAATSFVDPKSTVEGFAADVMERGSEAVAEAPTGKEAFKNLGMSDEPIFPPNYMVPDFANVSPAGVAGGGLEMASDPMTYASPKMLSGAVNVGLDAAEASIKNFGGKQATKVLNKWLTKTKALKEGVDPESIGKQLFEEDIQGLLSEPTKLKDFLGGSKNVIELVSPLGNAYKVSKNGGGGAIKNIADDVVGMVEEASRQNPDKGYLLKDSLAKMAKFNILEKKSSELSGEFYNDKIKSNVKSLIDDLLIRGESSRMKAMSPRDLLALKRNIGKKLRSQEFFKLDSDTQALAKEVMVDVNREIDNFLVSSLDEMPVQYGDEFIENTGAVFKIQNRRLKNLIDMSEVLEGIDLKEINKADLPQLIMGAVPWIGAGGLIGTVGGYGTGKGMMIGGAFPFARAASKKMMEKSPQILTKGAKSIEKGIDLSRGAVNPTLMAAPQAAREQMNDVGRQPQSVDMSINAKMNFMLADTDIPRSTEWIKAHPNLVVGRIMQVAPELAAQVQIAIEKGQDQILKKTLPLIAQQAPEIFEYDEFGSFDGKIVDPNMRQMYTDRVMSDQSIDMYRKAEIIDHLNKTNEVL